MSRRVFRLLLLLLPPRHRTRYGRDMVELFEQLRRDERHARGSLATALLDVRELIGVIHFILREWLAYGREALPGGCADVGTELRWVWRGIRSRSWGAPLIVVLLAAAIAATATTFAVADSLVFNRHPFPDADRIVVVDHVMEDGRRPDRAASAMLHDEWRRHHDLFSAVGGFLQKGGVFLQYGQSSDRVDTADITIEFLDVLGVAPAWGRSFTEADLDSDETYATLISERFARRRFGHPDAALGQRLEATGRPLVVVGVMPDAFAFPSAGIDLWRLMDLRGPLTTNFGGVTPIARLASSVPPEAADQLVGERAAAIGAAVGWPDLEARARPYFAETARQAEANREPRRLLLLLVGAGVSLLLISCANVASLELAHAIRRSRASAVRAALGASRLLLVRLALLESLALSATALLASLAMTGLLLALAESYLPASFIRVQNPVDLDTRTTVFSAVAAGLAWLLLFLPAVVHALRPPALSSPDRTTAPRGARMRHRLTVVQVALAVALVIVGLMYGRSYRELLALDKGFDSAGVAVASVSVPADYFTAHEGRELVTNRLLNEVRRLPGVIAASRSSPPPSAGDSPMPTPLWIDGRQVLDEIRLGQSWVDLAYFDVTRLPVVAGRLLEPGDPPTHVVIPESFAQRFWPDGSAVGGTIRGGHQTWFRDTMTVVGVVGDFRRNATGVPDEQTPLFCYRLFAPPAGSAPAAIERQGFADSGGSFGVLTVSVRVDRPQVLPEVQAAVQQMDPRLAVSLTLVDDAYARLNAPILLAARSVGIFGSVSLAIAMAGLYGVIAFVVASRTREIGIRMALGAAASDIRHMVLATSGRIAAVGAALGAALAFLVARWIESQLFGVSPTDPATYVLVVGAVGLTAVAATWMPARRAAAVDPAVTLRAE